MGHPGHPRGDLALSLYRRLGADLPFGDPRRAHGVGMEGYYWRFGDPAGAWSVAVIAGVCRSWAMITLAAQPGGFARTSVAPVARAFATRLGVEAGLLLSAGADAVRVRLADDAWLDAGLDARREWPRRAWGALGPAHWVPGLGQYWSPHLLGARVTGAAVLGGGRIDLSGAHAYAEKNWGAAFARHWWWGHAWLSDDAGVAFAGGRLGLLGAHDDAGVAFAGGRLRALGALGAPTGVVVWTPAGLVRLAPPFARTVAGAGGGAWRVRARSARYAVELEGEATEPALRLPVPIPAERRLEPRSDHHLRGRLRVTVWRGRRLFLRADSSLAALEDGRPR